MPEPDVTEIRRRLLHALPWPLAQALRRAHNEKTAQGRHNAAYLFFEATLKLAACAQIGTYISLGSPDQNLNKDLEALARASAGTWLQLLRAVSEFNAGRGDAALLPLAGVHARLKERAALPAATAFLKRAEDGGGSGAGKTTPLDFFEALVAYRNHELGHGAQREASFYESAAGLILSAVIEVVEFLKPFGDLQLGLSRDVPVDVTGETVRRFMVLKGDGLVDYVDGTKEDAALPAGRLWLFQGALRVPLHPLVIYESGESDRVGFLNRVVGRPQGNAVVVRRCEYLDYYSGDRLQSRDAAQELAALFTTLLKTQVTVAEVEKLAGAEDSADLVLAPKAGNAIIGDYEILGELGRGGMGVVYKARQHSLNRIVALKVLPPALGGDPVRVARFRREVRALSRCDHPNVVKVLSAGEDGDRLWYAMEYVEGSDLAGLYEVLARWGSLSGGVLKEAHLKEAINSASTLSRVKKEITSSGTTDSVEVIEAKIAAAIPDIPRIFEGRNYYVRLAEVISEAAEGVQHLHERGVIHRDLKPANIMLTSDGKRAVVMDLGLALVEDASMSLTKSQDKIVGTLRYMSPEQADMQLRDDLVDERSDIYSLGATLYELATLTPIFEARNEIQLLEKVQRKEPVHPRKANRSIPEDLATIVLKATAKDRDQRYPRAGAGSRESPAASLAEDLRAFSKSEPIRARPPSAFHYLALFYRRNSTLVHAATAGALMLLVAVFGVMFKLDQRRIDAETAWGEAAAEAVRRERSEALFETRAKAAKLLVDAQLGASEARASWQQYGGSFDSYRESLLRAAETAMKAASVDTDYAAPHSTAGACLRDAGEPVRARAAFERALVLDPSDHVALLGLAEMDIENAFMSAAVLFLNGEMAAQLQEGSLRRALGHLDALCASAEASPEARERLPGLRLLAGGKAKEASGEFARAAEKSPRPSPMWAYAALADLRFNPGEQGKILHEYAEKAVQLSPRDPLALSCRALIAVSIRDADTAQRCLDECVLRNPRYAPAYYHRAMFRYYQLKYWEREPPLSEDENNALWLKWTPGILSDLDRAWELDPNPVFLPGSLQFRLLIAYGAAADPATWHESVFDKVIEEYDRFLVLFPGDQMIHQERAGAAFTAAVRLWKFKPEERKQRFPRIEEHLLDSIDHYLKCAEMDSGSAYLVRARMTLARFRREMGKIDADAENEELRELLKMMDDNVARTKIVAFHHEIFRGQLLARLGRGEEAIALLQKKLDGNKWRSDERQALQNAIDEIRGKR
ncbi:MAG: serine/threonine protein [Planctomycetota bacterium]|nr:MAG: serine/threonine protein [Planctomycetota bacterium]